MRDTVADVAGGAAVDVAVVERGHRSSAPDPTAAHRVSAARLYRLWHAARLPVVIGEPARPIVL